MLHADGFGTRRQKLATYHFIARPHQFTMGFKLFYDEDVRRFDAADVRRIRPGCASSATSDRAAA